MQYSIQIHGVKKLKISINYNKIINIKFSKQNFYVGTHIDNNILFESLQ